jgi:hypothetical protein
MGGRLDCPNLQQRNQGISMKSSYCIKSNQPRRGAGFSVSSLAVAAVLGACALTGASGVHAQTTVAAIFGSAPAGQTITVHSMTTGANRHSKSNASGRYHINSLPLGDYSVSLEKDGKAVDTRHNIGLKVGGGAEVDFACVHDQCAESAGS